MDKDTRRLALVSVILGICMVTLVPIHPGLLQQWQEIQMGHSPAPFLKGSRVIFLYDIIQNILLFLPVGFLYADGRPQPGRFSSLARASMVAFALSASIEYAQTFLPGRFTSYWDIAFNTVGGALGALIRKSVRLGGGNG